MKRVIPSEWALVLAAILFGGVSRLAHAQPERKEGPAKAFDAVWTAKTKLLVPAYFYPAGDGLKEWDRLLDGSARAPVVAIVNPASGPGKEVDPLYSKLVERCRQSTVVLIGYVSSSYAKRPFADVKADIDAWLRFYPGIQGIFVDEQASGPEKVEYYASVYKYVRERRQLKIVITNPGTICSEKYLSFPAADAACVFEGPRPPEEKDLPEWLARQGGSRAALLSYKTAGDSMRRSIAAAAKKKIGYVYVTDAEGNNPWNRLPSYWNDEVAEVEKLNRLMKK